MTSNLPGASRHAAVVAVVAVAALLLSAGPGAAVTTTSSTSTAKAGRLAALQASAAQGKGSASAGELGALQKAVASEDRVVLVVRASHGHSLGALAAAARAAGGTLRQTLTPLHSVSFSVPAARAKAVAATLSDQPGVASVDVAVRRYALGAPDDPGYPSQASYLNAITAPAAWDVQPGSPAVKIAIIDTGVNVNHLDLASKIVDTYNAFDQSTDVTDDVGHGTFVAGVAAATTNNGVGVAGAGDASSLLAVKVADPNGIITTDVEAEGIIWAADNGANVINISLGSTDSDQTEKDAIDYALSKGAVVVAAAGNDGLGANAKDYPAGYPEVISVGATDGTDPADFSEHGTWVTVAAPGVGIISTSRSGGYASGSGTSFSSPLVAGEVALLVAQSPTADAAALRHAVVASAHGFAGDGLGAGQVDFAAALNRLAPTSTPTITAPLAAATVSGVVTLTATSSAPAVRFQADGVWLGAPVSAASGTATGSWPTWGASNGSRLLKAVDCTMTLECATTADSVSVSLNNSAPAVTSPTGGQQVSGAFTATATSRGGGVAFLVDGTRRGFAAAAPYSFTSSASTLTDGTHLYSVIECSSDGVSCAGPRSTDVGFTAKSLHPTFNSLLPAVFSPNADHRLDTTTAAFTLPDAESVVVSVRASSGTMVATANLGPLGVGAHSWTWTGGGQADGIYTVTLATTSTVDPSLHGDVSRSVRIDTVAPTMTSVTGTGRRFYPYHDGYRDKFIPAFTLNEGGTQTMTVRTKKGALVRKIDVAQKAGRASFSWNGKDKHKKSVAAGTYKWTLTATDVAGNVRSSAAYTVHLSRKRLVSRTALVKVHGKKTYNAGGSDSSCAGSSFKASDFAPHGVWLGNVCTPQSADIAAAFFHITLPKARVYKSVRLDTYGNTTTAPSRVRGAFLNVATDSFELTAGVRVQGFRWNEWHSLGTRPGSTHVSSRHVVTAAVFVTTHDSLRADFDIDYVRIKVEYSVLK